MARVRHAVATRKRHRRMVKQAKGYWGKRSKLFRRAKESVWRALSFATRDRKARKGDFRRLWITRIHAAAQTHGVPYNRFMAGLKAANVGLDRKILADLAVTDEAAFRELAEVAKAALTPSTPLTPSATR